MTDVDESTIPAPSGAPVPVPPPTRAGRSMRDVLLSVAVLVVPLLLLVTLYRVFFAGDAPVAVDPSDAYASARHSASFTVLEPHGLPAGWTVTSAWYGSTDGGSTLRVGYQPPSRDGVQLIESDRPIDALLRDELGTGARPGDLATIGGRQWRAYPVARDGDRALVLAGNGVTAVIIGTASDQDMRVLARILD
jgi:hypothetical protein